MNALNLINIIKMSCFISEFKNHLEILSPEKQLHVINHVINQFNKSNRLGENIVILNDLKNT